MERKNLRLSVEPFLQINFVRISDHWNFQNHQLHHHVRQQPKFFSRIGTNDCRQEFMQQIIVWLFVVFSGCWSSKNLHLLSNELPTLNFRWLSEPCLELNSRSFYTETSVGGADSLSHFFHIKVSAFSNQLKLIRAFEWKTFNSKLKLKLKWRVSSSWHSSSSFVRSP